MEAKNNNRVPTEQATHLSCDMEEKNATLQQELEKARELIERCESTLEAVRQNIGKPSQSFINELTAFLEGTK